MIQENKQKKYYSANGNALFEYVFPLGLVAVTLIISSQLFIQQVPGIMTNTLGGDLSASQVGVNPMGTNASVANANGSSAATPSTVIIQLSNGGTITLPQFVTDYSQLVDTSGAQGTTTTISDNIDLLIDELYNSGEISNDQVQVLKGLSNLGHQIAMVQGLLQQAAGTTGNSGNFNSQTIQYNGQTYTPLQLTQQYLGWSGTVNMKQANALNNQGVPNLIQQATTQPGTYVQSFSALYLQAKNSGSLNNPAVNKIITELSQQIMMTSVISQYTASQISKNKISPKQFKSSITKQAKTASQSSQGICQAVMGTSPGPGNGNNNNSGQGNNNGQNNAANGNNNGGVQGFNSTFGNGNNNNNPYYCI
ncbi:MAG: hypothetical protein KTR14_03415 [Vampirovibrio sp.]|nr:hypothetical protein [Vampirovibrio sp.]